MDRLRELGERIEAREARIGVIGLGYVGLPLALEFAKAGFRVMGFDLDAAKVETLHEGRLLHRGRAGRPRSPSAVRDGPLHGQHRLRRALALRRDQRLRADAAHARPRIPTSRFIVRAVEEIRKRLRSGQLIVLGSTTYPGTTHELFVPMLEEHGPARAAHDFALAFAPERIDPANQQFALREVPKVVGGETPLCGELARASCSRRSSTTSCRSRRRRAPRW